jgi:hypothetical protein
MPLIFWFTAAKIICFTDFAKQKVGKIVKRGVFTAKKSGKYRKKVGKIPQNSRENTAKKSGK